ncbi:tRNA (adenosine(37)-N6)-threonylcarbamoyltransferase complex dimerization subunit type 1 TsaB [Lutibacter sp. TH_r2]|uniref:tRNA (adenosine(37)-N6)-threonylcarbamoyltransferase complex dimerization subunit type 1 TsaB n=1 Tax=Lutibacter sp. TH_r2 TaxID=3082083 RepID=UPI002953896F|nr:tRNA (adenosine(37)-N6)-threonylcarbamoyltransferase complex dimerization subunit type 1 TsaB [Lutibacter sp. TH_r2]MDV7186882.1 tRNA (adenosine(37)-N6)-threonylcarbamoyltransferase complex dimerization subunit type 1 TsaB [Lutibacter sp. TH_r2]
MALILNIETATKNCSVCLAEEGKILALKEFNEGGYSHAEKLHQFINDVIKESGKELSEIKAVAVSKGPGSYTGLRIGVSAAKGLCFALEVPLISINTLISLADSISIANGFKVALLDARRMEVYSQVLNYNNEILEEVKAEIIDKNSFEKYLTKGEVTFLGDGAEKCKAVIQHLNAKFIDNKFPSAKEMALLSYNKYKKNDIEDVAYFEPFYLKDFVVVKSKK